MYRKNKTIWGFDDGTGTRSPGPTYQAFYGKPQLTRNINSLPNVNQVNNTGFGMPSVSTHLHNAHKPSESDGTRATSIPRDTSAISTIPTCWRASTPTMHRTATSTNR